MGFIKHSKIGYELSSGIFSRYLIDCKELSENELRVIANIIAENVPPFGAVHAIPTGGIPIARELEKVRSNWTEDILIIDDVYTTGRTMKKHEDLVKSTNNPSIRIYKAVIFSRAESHPLDVFCVFKMNGPTVGFR